jgi:glucose 1-dehydrogenase
VVTDARPVTVVTGGTRGIGAAVALALAAAGHDLVLGYLDDAAAAQAVAAQVHEVGARAVTVAGDVAAEETADALFDAAVDLGPVTGLVNNAGLTAHLGDLADTPVDVIRRVVDVNLLGALLCARRAAGAMAVGRGGRGGAIVNISSAAATLGSPHEYVHYAAAKAGVDALTVGLAKELASDGVRVNAVAPGLVATDIHAGAGDPARLERVVHRVPVGRVGPPTEVAAAVTWLLSDAASYVTGAVLRVSGGL